MRNMNKTNAYLMMAQNVVAFIEPQAEARANDFLIRLITVSNGQQQQQRGGGVGAAWTRLGH